MTAEYCVDYLSHKWTSPDDLVQTFLETRKQCRRSSMDDMNLTPKELKRAETENYKLQRFQNALWREMARNCTNKLSKQNRLIDPASVSWQKESDITWLFGPMYTNNKKCNQNLDRAPSASLQGLKPVLKKQRNVTLPALSDKNAVVARNSFPSLCSPSSPSSKSSTKSGNQKTSHGVRFNPEIIEIQYQPDHPINSSTPSSMAEKENNNYDFDDDYEMDDIDEIWASIVTATVTFKSDALSQFKSFAKYFQSSQSSPLSSLTVKTSAAAAAAAKKQLVSSYLELLHHSCRPDGSLQLVILLLSMAKSVFSLTTTWILYQSLAPFSWFAKPLFQRHNAAGQYKNRLL